MGNLGESQVICVENYFDKMKKIISSILLLAILSPVVSAQDVGVPDWEIGWDSDKEPMIMELDSNYKKIKSTYK